jgi:Pvc16 N-terminal domain
VASYRAVNGVLLSLEHFFKTRMPTELSGGSVNATVKLFGSATIDNPQTGNFVGIYLHRIAIDPHGRARFFSPQGNDKNAAPEPELPVNLHFMLMASGTSASIEADLLAWAMVTLANESRLDISHLSDYDSGWTEKEVLTVTPEEVNTEDQLRMWQTVKADYTLSVPYVVRTLRLRLRAQETLGPAVISRVFPTGIAATNTAAL